MPESEAAGSGGAMTPVGASTIVSWIPWAARFSCARRCLSDHLPVGVSSHNNNIAIATVVIQIPGTTNATLHAT